MKEEDVLTIEDELNDDWLRASRLKKKAEQGDEQAKRELERMEQTKLVGIEKPTKTVICGYAQEGDRYLSFSSTPNDVTIHSTFKVDDFPSYEHFAAVIGKIAPYLIMFLALCCLPCF